MQPIKNIMFDLGGVLINLDMNRTKQALYKMGVLNIDELFGIGHATSIFKEYEIGAIDDETFIQQLLKLTGGQYNQQAVKNAWNALLLDFPPERIALLDYLKKKYRLYLFSNTNALHLQAFQQIYRGAFGHLLDSHFEKAYYSHLIKLRKPDVEAYKYVVDDAGIRANETLFIDDALVNIEGARKAGLQAIHLEPGKTILDLQLETV